MEAEIAAGRKGGGGTAGERLSHSPGAISALCLIWEGGQMLSVGLGLDLDPTRARRGGCPPKLPTRGPFLVASCVVHLWSLSLVVHFWSILPVDIEARGWGAGWGGAIRAFVGWVRVGVGMGKVKSTSATLLGLYPRAEGTKKDLTCLTPSLPAWASSALTW